MEYASYSISTLHYVAKAGLDNTRFCNLQANESFISTANGTCDYIGYGESLAFIAAPGIVVGGVCLITSIVLIFALCCLCCKCCDGGPSKLCLAIFILGALALAIAGLVVTLTGNTGVDNGVNGLETTVTQTGADLVIRINNITDLLDSLNDTSNSQNLTTGLQQARLVVGEINLKIDNITHTYIDPYKQIRSAAVLVGCIVPVVIVALGLLFVLCRLNGCIGFTAWLLMFLVFVVWMSLSVHLVANEVILDVCVEIDTINNDPSLAGDTPLSLIISCTANDSAFAGLQSQVNDTKNTAVAAGCNKTQELCDDGIADCSNFTCSEATLPQVYNLTVNDTVFVCTTGPPANTPADCPGGIYTSTDSQRVTIADCPTMCNNTDLVNATIEINNRGHDLQQLLAVLDQLIPLLSCDFITTAFDSVQTQLCVNFTNAVKQIWSGNALSGAGMVLASLVFIYAYCGFKAEESGGGRKDDDL